jgi:parvulin-like peptidyl-prolyl isomerase
MAERTRSARAARWIALSLIASATLATAGFVVADPQKKGASPAQKPAAPPAKSTGKSPAAKPAEERPTISGSEAIVARVNKDEITYKELAEECIARRGVEVLETMIHKMLVLQACREHGIKITPKEIDDEIGRTAARLKMTREQYLRVLESERGIPERRYIEDLIVPGLALRKLAKPLVRVSETDIQTSFEAHYGEKVKCRWLVCDDGVTAAGVWKELHESDRDQDGTIDLKEFERHVTRSSTDEGSRSLGGQIQPIPRHTGPVFAEIEKAAFALKTDGEISPVVRYGDKWVILYRESYLQPLNVKLEDVRGQLESEIYDAKMSDQMRQVFEELEKKSTIEKFVAGSEQEPASNAAAKNSKTSNAAELKKSNAASKAMPFDGSGEPIAARVNGEVITYKALAAEVISRRGTEVLETMIFKRLVKQTCQKQNITVTAQEIDAEIERLAKGLSKSRKAYADFVKEQTGLELSVFAQDRIWATLALRKFAAPTVTITEDDVRRGFEALYGEKVKCRWITFSDLKLATDVWNKLHDSADADGKIQLAEFERQVTRYSTDVATRALGGQLQPITRHTSPTFQALEQAAFALKEDGEISKVVQVLDTYVILYREALIPGTDTKLESVRDELVAQIREAKVGEETSRIAREMQRNATIENLLTGEMSSPTKDTAAAKPGTTVPGATKREPVKVGTAKDATNKPQQPVRK